MDIGAALWGGIAGAVAMVLVYWGLRALRLTRFDLVRFSGGFVTAERHGIAYLYGILVMLVLGALVAVGYSFVFERLSAATYVGWGALLGLGTGVLVLLLLPLAARLNQQVRHGVLGRPGVAGVACGPLTPVALLVAFAVFGVWAGSFVVPGP